MISVAYIPRNGEHFHKLFLFLIEIMKLCVELKVNPIIYGSLAYAFYSGDESIDINDIDILVPENSFMNLIQKIKENRLLRYEETTYHSLKIFKNDIKIAFDAIEIYNEGLSSDFNKIIINNLPITIVSFESLMEMYRRGAEGIPIKRREYLKKLMKLHSLNEII